jgi:hypothetical protein
MPMSPEKFNEEVNKLRTSYNEDPKQSTFNLLLLGESGSVKTFILRTARKPIHLDSFDPGGSKGIRDMIDKGELVVDARYEGDEPLSPRAFAKWKTEFSYRVSSGYFENFGTYVLDSATTWSMAIMNYILLQEKRAGEAPKWNKDYTPQKIEIRNHLTMMLNIPCDFILTGHLKAHEVVEGESSTLEYRFMTTGDGSVIIPLMFDEIWVMDPSRSVGGVNFRVLTQSTGKHLARSRLSKNGLLSQHEAPDLKAILKKARLNPTDKPLLK